MLAYTATIFLQAQGIGARLNHLSSELGSCILNLDFNSLGEQEIDLELKIWILFVTAISGSTDEDDVWLLPLLKQMLARAGMKDEWGKVRGVLKALLWIDALHDKDGKRIFEKIQSPLVQSHLYLR